MSSKKGDITMNEQTNDLQAYMSQGIRRIVADAARTALTHPAEAAFLARYAAASAKQCHNQKNNHRQRAPAAGSSRTASAASAAGSARRA